MDLSAYDAVLGTAELFRGIDADERSKILGCLDARVETFDADAWLLTAGATTSVMGVLLAGAARIEMSDAWGNTSVIGGLAPGDVFAEVYALRPTEPLRVSVVAQSKGAVLWVQLSGHLRLGARMCSGHQVLVENLMHSLAGKNLQLSAKLDYTTPKSLRARVSRYLSDCALAAGGAGLQGPGAAGVSFTVPFDRQGMADYLQVDRSALSAELSRMQKEGLITYERSHFTVHRGLGEK